MTRDQALDEAVRRWRWAWSFQDRNGRQIVPPDGAGGWAEAQIRAEFRRITAGEAA